MSIQNYEFFYAQNGGSNPLYEILIKLSFALANWANSSIRYTRSSLSLVIVY